MAGQQGKNHRDATGVSFLETPMGTKTPSWPTSIWN